MFVCGLCGVVCVYVRVLCVCGICVGVVRVFCVCVVCVFGCVWLRVCGVCNMCLCGSLHSPSKIFSSGCTILCLNQCNVKYCSVSQTFC